MMLLSQQSGGLAISLLVVLATAVLVATLFRRLKMEAIPGYLLAGFLVGPVLGLVSDEESITQISRLATILLMFTIGLHLEIATIRRDMLSILLIGAVSTLAFVLVAWPLGLLTGLSAPRALIFAMALSMSSTALLLRLLQQRRELRLVHGRLCIGVSIVQDLLSVVVIAVLPPIAVWAGGGVRAITGEVGGGEAGPLAWDLLAAGAAALVGVSVLFLAGRYLLPRLLREVARTSSTELVMVVGAAVALGAALAAEKFGFSAELGAFLGGLLVGSTPFKQQMHGQFGPMRDLLMPIFFTAVGLKAVPGALLSEWPTILIGVGVVIVVKALVVGFVGWALGASASVATLSGIYLAQAGEFSIVILGQAAGQGALTSGEYSSMIAVTVLSLVAAPMLVAPAQRLAARVQGLRLAPWLGRARLETAREPAEGSGIGTVVIAGYGPVGRHMAERFTALGVPFTVIDLNPTTIAKQTKLGRAMVFGDVTNTEVLESAGVSHADAVVLTIPDEEATLAACAIIRRMNPEAFIAARTNYLSRGIQARSAGADAVVVEEIATAEAMEREVLGKLKARRATRAQGATP